MSCERWRDLILTDYLDGEITPADRDALTAHVADCPACRHLLERAATTLVEPFQRLERVSPPPAVWEQIAAEMGIDPEVGKADLSRPLPPPAPDGSGHSGCGTWMLAVMVAGGLVLAAVVAFWFLAWGLPPAPVVPPPTVTLPTVATPSGVPLSHPDPELVPAEPPAAGKISSGAELFGADGMSKEVDAPRD